MPPSPSPSTISASILLHEDDNSGEGNEQAFQIDQLPTVKWGPALIRDELGADAARLCAAAGERPRVALLTDRCVAELEIFEVAHCIMMYVAVLKDKRKDHTFHSYSVVKLFIFNGKARLPGKHAFPWKAHPCLSDWPTPADLEQPSLTVINALHRMRSARCVRQASTLPSLKT